MAKVCDACGGRAEWREKETRKFRVQDPATKEWRDELGEVWVDMRCRKCNGSGMK